MAHRSLPAIGFELGHAARALRRSPAFTAVAVLTLALGIGATTAIYSVVDTILLQPLPFAEADRLVRVREQVAPAAPGRPIVPRDVPYGDFLAWRERATALVDAVAVLPMAQRMVETEEGATGLWGAMTSADLFAGLGVRALHGRPLIAEDAARPDVVVLSFDTWRRHFRSRPDVVGTVRAFRAGALQQPGPDRLLTIVGVLPADFQLPTGVLDFYTPMALDPSLPAPRVTMLARIAPGAPFDAAVEEINVLGAAARPPWPADAPALTGPRFALESLKEGAIGPMRPALRVLLAAVAVVLLIVCANVANLMLARGTARQREIAVRLALGASRARIAGQVMLESVLLALMGGALGAALGAVGLELVSRLATVDAPGIFRLGFGASILPRGHELAIDAGVLAIALGLALATSVLFGVLPAFHVSRTNHVEAIGTRGGGARRSESRIRAALVVAQLVLATMLLVGAGLLAHSFVRLSAVNNGYDPSGLLAFNLLFPSQYSTTQKAATIEALLARLRAMPTVHAAGFARHGLLIGEELTIGTFVPAGRSLDEMLAERTRVRSVSDGYLTAMGVPVLAGRDLSRADDRDAPRAVVVSRSAARRYFGTSAAVGQVMDWHVGKARVPVTVVGVVEDVRQESPTDEVRAEVFVDYRQFLSLLEGLPDLVSRQNEWAIGFLSFAVRTGGDPAAAVPTIRQAVMRVDDHIGIDAIAPMSRLLSSSLARPRFFAVLLGVFAAIAAALAAVGVYGVLAYAVVQRTHEIGVRMALGARRAQVLTLVLRSGALLAGTGIALGLAGAAAGTHAMRGMLYGITPLDAGTFAVVALAFGAVAMVASYVPARRAATVDPMTALRRE